MVIEGLEEDEKAVVVYLGDVLYRLADQELCQVFGLLKELPNQFYE